MEINRIRDGGLVLRQVMQTCGKKNCRCNPLKVSKERPQKLHGPYWYYAYWRGGRWHEKYIGKTLMGVRAQTDPRVRDALGEVLERYGCLDEGRKAIHAGQTKNR